MRVKMRQATATSWLFLVCAMSYATAAWSARIELELRASGDAAEGPLVISLHSPAAEALVRPTQAQMDQRDRQFFPDLLVVPAGSTVAFPNSDDIRHHVYSFSPARRFELPLYGGSTADPVEFPAPGVVVLGCNIHDWMQAHILVMDTPYVREVQLESSAEHWLEAPAGDYVLRVWHARLDAESPWIERSVRLGEQEIARLELELPLRPAQAPALSDDAQLRALQERFRALRKEP